MIVWGRPSEMFALHCIVGKGVGGAVYMFVQRGV